MSEQAKRWPCEIQGDEVIPCHGLESCLEPDNYSGKGVSMLLTMNLNTGRLRRVAVVLKSGEHKKKGIVLNFCPFCGTDIVSHLEERKEVAVDA